MKRSVGVIARGIRTPIVSTGDKIEEIVTNSIQKAAEMEGFSIQDRDIIGVTESVVARAQGNYASADDIKMDINNKYDGETLGVLFPILSRNRFAVLLKGIARGAKHIVLMLQYPSDEVGNPLVSIEKLDEKGIDPWKDNLTEEGFYKAFGETIHPFTGINYIEYYRSIIETSGAKCTILFSNRPEAVLSYTEQVLTCDVHTRLRTKKQLLKAGAKKVYGLDDILITSMNGSGYNPEYGLLGSNKATEETVKLFPRDSQKVAEEIQAVMKERTGKKVEVLVYGDGAFKDPQGKIWELADPVVSPGYTVGLEGTPNEVKIKYLADNDFADLKGEALKAAIAEHIKNKKENLTGAMEAQGTTPRKLTDLIGSLCDLTSGSGDKGTPVVYIQGYFDSYIEA
ncbi:F420-0:Gamma-glutamyl ligase [Tindallia magadiensis]|uniref:F420-0:Gamma-glutamyl ligase n=1 Tax=Tindallia magadiensis TaxID=69895 RepID=A0A1I3E720_9FIRM|nr:coenzyme F420-0:L-glutamate ligase [Tindallia magadiensis]SFH94782.1 F420-0:Gamma-glutamyl ligase [Tindallia magadiensis]